MPASNSALSKREAKDRTFNAVLQPVLLRRTGRSVIGWSAWGREGAFGLGPAGFWMAVGAVGDTKASTRAPGREPTGAGQVTLAGRMVWSGTPPTRSPVDLSPKLGQRVVQGRVDAFASIEVLLVVRRAAGPRQSGVALWARRAIRGCVEPSPPR